MRTILAGNYTCSWAGAGLLCSVTSLGPGSGDELLNDSYPRAAVDGTHTLCAAARLPLHDADLDGAAAQARSGPAGMRQDTTQHGREPA